MIDIEKMLEKASTQEVQIPSKIEYRIQYTLKNKNKKSWKLYIKKVITAIISAIIVFIGGISVYAAFGGTILGRPIFAFYNMKFLDEYENYQVKVKGEKFTHNETEMELVSTICDEYYVLLEFNMRFSEEDKQLLRLGENYITEKDFEKAEKVEDEMWKQHLIQHYTEYQNDINTFYMELGHVYIDNKEFWPGKIQTVNKISDYEYKVYHILFITDQEWDGKSEFKLTISNCFINTDTERLSGEYPTGKLHMGTSGSGGNFYMNGEISVNVSKEKAVENTQTIIPESSEATYKYMTKTVEKIEITPMQIIAKISTTINNVSLNSLTSTRHKDHIGVTSFDVYGSNGEELDSIKYETRRKITYSDGTVEEWARGDIGTYKTFYNAKMELEEIIIIEKKEGLNSIKIVPTVEEINLGHYASDRTEKKVELQEFNIKLKD